MKKVLFMLFISVLVLVGCGEEDVSKEKDNEENEPTENLEEEKENEKDENKEVDEEEIHSKEVKQFVEEFNNLASTEEIETIESVEPAQEKESGYSQVLYTSKDYVITTDYEKSGEVKNYVVLIADDQPYRDLKGSGFNAMMNVGEFLELDTDELKEEFEEVLPTRAGLYKTDDYTITFSKDEEVPEIGIIIMFMKL